jgi:hypothetical protein
MSCPCQIQARAWASRNPGTEGDVKSRAVLHQAADSPALRILELLLPLMFHSQNPMTAPTRPLPLRRSIRLQCTAADSDTPALHGRANA